MTALSVNRIWRFGWLGPGVFRLILALAVFVSHVSKLGIGRPGVILFFILSGYWVTRLYQRWDGTVPQFVASRWLRIFPLLFVVAVTMASAQYAGLVPRHGSLASTLFLLGLASRQGDLIGVCWSLDIELQFYLALPLCFAVALLLRRQGVLLSPASWQALGLIVVLIGAIGMRNGWPTVLGYAPAFAAGAAIQLLSWAPSSREAGVSLAAFVVVGVVMALLPATASLIIKGDLLWWHDLVYQMWCLVLVPCLAWSINRPSPPLDRALGNLAFPFYLVHFPVIAISVAQLGASGAAKSAALTISVSLSLLLYHYLDKPIEAWRQQLWRRGVPA